MRVPLRWLAEFVDLPAGRAIAAALTLGGLEVESVERIGPDLSGVRVGHVLERAQHPNADRLSVCRVDLGDRRAGRDRVRRAERRGRTEGRGGVAGRDAARRQEAREGEDPRRRLERHDLLGDASSASPTSSDGILVLDASAKVGAPLARGARGGRRGARGRAHAEPRRLRVDARHRARGARALRRRAAPAAGAAPTEDGEPAAAALRVAIEDPDGCPRYVRPRRARRRGGSEPRLARRPARGGRHARDQRRRRRDEPRAARARPAAARLRPRDAARRRDPRAARARRREARDARRRRRARSRATTW